MTEEVTPDAQVHPALAELASAMNAKELSGEGSWTVFTSEESVVDAEINEAADRVVVDVVLEASKPEVVERWVGRQPMPYSGTLTTSYDEFADEAQPTLRFGRPIDHDSWSNDPLFDDIRRFRHAWETATDVPRSTASSAFVVTDDPRNLTPESAWLLKGDEASFPTGAELEKLRNSARVGIYDQCWTGASTTKKGDLVLVYFVAPRKAVHFVARAASDAYFSRSLEVNSDSKVSSTQWWIDITPPVEIVPISVQTLRSATNGYLLLRGRSGLFITPETVRALTIQSSRVEDQAEVEYIAIVPSGLADLPSPQTMTFSQWRGLASGALALEAHVSSHIVRPILRMALAGTNLTLSQEYPVSRRRADFVVLDDDQPVHVIEVKKRIRHTVTQPWAECGDFTQVRWYADQLGVRATLIDAHSLMLIDESAVEPTYVIDRTEATDEHVRLLRAHILGR